VSDGDAGTLAVPLDPLGITVAELLDTVADTPSRPGSGAAAALVTALAASIAGASARASRAEWSDAAGVAAQADSLGHRARALAHDNAGAYEKARFALERSRAMPSLRVAELPEMMSRSIDVLLRIGEAAVDVAELSQAVAARATGDVRADAAAAAALAGGAAAAVTVLVQANLVVTPDDERVQQARVLASRADDAVRAAARDVGS
jgi:formiminotetrahydrofolate cyclodeaminase